MRPELVDLLRCPLCGQALAAAERSLRCASGHCFDVARQGYVNLLPGNARRGTADTPEMVAARETFLSQGHFAGLRRLVSDTAVRCARAQEENRADAQVIIDAGGGTGYYLAPILDCLPESVGLVLDLSKHSLRRAARAHERAGAVACDVWRGLPIGDGAASLILDIFAPRNGGEFRRVLHPQGCLIVITPTARHLRELVTTVGLLTVDRRKHERLEETFAGLFVLAETHQHEEDLTLDHEAAATLVAMGPSAHHLDSGLLRERLEMLPHTLRVTLSVALGVYRPAPSDAPPKLRPVPHV